jgi:hypothetical protein
MNSAQKIGSIPHIKDSVKIMDSDTFKQVFKRDVLDDFNKSILIKELTKIEENNSNFILSSEVMDLYKEIQSKCKSFKEKISKSIFNIESNIVNKFLS